MDRHETVFVGTLLGKIFGAVLPARHGKECQGNLSIRLQ
jgi:hypothetical protein